MLPKKKDYKRIIGFWLAVFLVGGASGVFFSRTFLPWLTSFAPFNEVAWLCDVKDNTTIVNRTEKIYVSEETAYQEAAGKIGNAVVAVRVERPGRAAVQNSGFILTGDGLVVTADFVLAKDAKILVSRDNKEYLAELVREDAANRLALLRIRENNLPVVEFGDSAALRLGARILLVGASKTNEVFARFVNIGFVRSLNPSPAVTFSESALADGAALGNIDGRIVGLALTDKQGAVKWVAVDKIKDLLK